MAKPKKAKVAPAAPPVKWYRSASTLKALAGVGIVALMFLYLFFGPGPAPSSTTNNTPSSRYVAAAVEEPIRFPQGQSPNCRGPIAEPLRVSINNRARVPHPSCQNRIDPEFGCVNIYNTVGMKIGEICKGAKSYLTGYAYEIGTTSGSIIPVYINECGSHATGERMDQCS